MSVILLRMILIVNPPLKMSLSKYIQSEMSSFTIFKLSNNFRFCTYSGWLFTTPEYSPLFFVISVNLIL